MVMESFKFQSYLIFENFIKMKSLQILNNSYDSALEKIFVKIYRRDNISEFASATCDLFFSKLKLNLP